MKRGETGTYQATSTSGEVVRAFVPAPLPPNPPLDFGGGLQPALEAAVLALGRLAHLLGLGPQRSGALPT